MEEIMFQRLVTSKSKKALLVSLRNVSVLVAITAVTGCTSLPETITGTGNQHVGYKPYDPCIRCGESWQVLPNEYMNALKTKKRWDAEKNGEEIPNFIDVTKPAEKIIIID